MSQLKPKIEDVEYVDDFVQPPGWEQLRDGEGTLMEGSYRTLPTPDSDSL